MSATEYLILVDEEDREIGQAEKLVVHQQNLLHRAFSVFIFRDDELLLQQRGLDKYHTGGLWTNTCCSHPRPNETILEAAKRRLKEELYLDVELRNIGFFHYNAHFANGLSENEIDHVLVGEIAKDVVPQPNQDEIHALRWVSIAELKNEMDKHPEYFTPWFEQALAIALNAIATH